MGFIDNLAFLLFSICFAGFLLLYIVSSMYLAYRRKKRDYVERLNGASIPLLIAGGYMVIAGIIGQATWPLPGSYNILFYDPLLAFGLLVLAFALAIRLKTRLEYTGVLGLLVGAMVLIYGYEGYTIGLTKSPLALLLLYVFYGVAGIFSYPVSLIYDRLPGLKKKPWGGWHVLLIIFWLAILAASLLAGYTAFAAISGHLVSAP